MPLSYKRSDRIIPTYSLTGDLLSFSRCNLRYRYYNKASLPPSKPVQMWFGQFIHSVMEEAFNYWVHNPNYHSFPWIWNPQIRDIELTINRRLVAQSLAAPSTIFCKENQSTTSNLGCWDNQHPHKLLASRRVEKAINTWGPHLFPLISEAEVKLTGIRSMPQLIPNFQPRSDYYEINGIIDVISGVNLTNTPPANLLHHKIMNISNVQDKLNQFPTNQYEIIIDIKV